MTTDTLTHPHPVSPTEITKEINAKIKYGESILFTKEEIIEILHKTGENWLVPNDTYRNLALQYLPPITGYSREMIRESLDITFREFTKDKLSRVSKSISDQKSKNVLITQILAGNVFVSGLFGIVYGLLTGVPQIVKSSSHEPLFPLLFLKSLIKINPRIAGLLGVYNWKGGNEEIENVVFKSSSLVIAYGDDETIDTLSKRIKSPTRLLGFGHKFSFGIVSKEFLESNNPQEIARNIAYDITMYDQQGCLSPHFYYIESGGELSPKDFSALLAKEMKYLNIRLPRGKISLQESVGIQQLRGTYEFRQLNVPSIDIHSSTPSTDWTVIFIDEPGIPFSCLNRFVYIKPYSDLHTITDTLKLMSGKVQSVGLGVQGNQNDIVTQELDSLKVNRFCQPGKMQIPAIDEIHPGKPNINDFM